MTTVDVLAPCPGRLLSIQSCSDPVFSGEIVGPGLLIEPDPVATTVVAPVAGTMVKVHPHAFVIAGDQGVAVLVHLGINTVTLQGAGFTVLTEQGRTVAAGDPMVAWHPGEISGDGITTEVPVVFLERPAGSVPAPQTPRRIDAGQVMVSLASGG